MNAAHGDGGEREAASRVLARLLDPRGSIVTAPDLRTFLAETEALRGDPTTPVDGALAAGRAADRLGFAFAAGYQAAIRALVPQVPRGSLASFCVTEEKGNHPRQIETTAVTLGDRVTLHGKKRWSTMAPLASLLVVIARTGADEAGRPVLRAMLVPHVEMTSMKS